MSYKKLRKKYADEDLAESMIFPLRLSPAEKKEAASRLAIARKNAQEVMSEKDRLTLEILQLKFQLEDYLQYREFKPGLTFGYFLRQYVDILQIKRKHFAREISIDETLLSQFINNHRLPPDYIAIRLEIHSNNSIPAIHWFMLVQKQKTYELKTDKHLRKKEMRFVRKKARI